MSDFKDRLVIEKGQLKDKILRLTFFKKEDKEYQSLSSTQKNLIDIQLHAMLIYEKCLKGRLEDLKENP